MVVPRREAMVSAFRKICEDNKVNGYYATRGSTPPLLGINFLPDERSLASHNDRVLTTVGGIPV